MSESPPREIDFDRLKEYAKLLFGHLGGAVTAGMVHLGDRLGLYRALAEGPATSVELAARSGLDERWVREWLRQQGAAGLLEWDADERFSLSPEAEATLANESHPAFGAGLFSELPQTMSLLERLPESFRTGLGLDYDALGPEGARGVERGFAPWYRGLLVPVAIPQLPGMGERLTAGARVADVGCGGGVALIELARAFPASRFHGYEISRHALARAEENRAQAGLGNVEFHHVDEEPLPDDERFDLVLTFDCLHDMTHPEAIMAAIRKAIRPDGVWLIADIKAHPSYAENVERNPMAPLLYGMSVLTCMSSALSAPGGAGLGALGLHAGLAEKLAREAGFTSFEAIELPHPVNAFYRVQP